jgi:ATP-dependent Lhr-like helicase
MRGELRGGRLVGGFVGEQFAAPEALESLRAIRREAPHGEMVRISACDPLNLVGIITPGPRVPATLANSVLFKDGVPQLAADEAPVTRASLPAIEATERADLAKSYPLSRSERADLAN